MRLGEFGPAPVYGRTMVILCAYRGGVGQREPWRCPSIDDRLGRFLAAFVDLATFYRFRVFIARSRDHYANPRSFERQVEIARAALAALRPSSVRALVDVRWCSGPLETLPFDPNPQCVALAETAPMLAEVDSVLLVYPDPIGLGFGALERKILSTGIKYVAVANGRSRLFPLTRRSRAVLQRRRFLAETRLPEIMAGIILLPIAAILAIIDGLSLRK